MLASAAEERHRQLFRLWRLGRQWENTLGVKNRYQ